MIQEEINKFKKELLLRKYAQSTIETYTSCLATIFQNVGTPLTIEKVKEFILTIQNRNYHKQIVATVRNYFYWVFKVEIDLSDLPYPRKEEKLPEILSVEEVQKIFSVNKNFKHQAIISLLYGCGLRVSEVINLKITDVDSSRMVINIRCAKGNKDRQIMMGQDLLSLLRNYFKEFSPKEFLFNGQRGLQYSESSINQFLKYYARKSGISKNVHAHKFRHSFATHLVDAGTDMSIIQKLMGHNNIKTTQHYAKISTGLISKVKSPLSNIKL